MSEIDNMLKKMLKESKKESKKKRNKTSKRKNILSRTKVNLMRKTHDKNCEERIRCGLERHHICATIEHRHCNHCQDVTTIISKIVVVSMTQSGEARITANVLTKGMYEFHHDLPITINEHDTTIAICPNCLLHDKNMRKTVFKIAS